MKKILVSFLLLLGAASLSAQSALETDKQALYNAELRNKLNIDYSMPDFSTSKLNANIIGYRLVWMQDQEPFRDKEYGYFLSLI